MSSTLWTIGYGGATLEHLIDALRNAGVATVIDTRANPYSPRPEFRRTALERALTGAGFVYVSLPALGAPRAIRSLPMDGSFEAAYASHLASAEPALAEVVSLAESGHVSLLCAEEDPASCHRSILAAVVARRLAADVTDLRPATASRSDRAAAGPRQPHESPLPVGPAPPEPLRTARPLSSFSPVEERAILALVAADDSVQLRDEGGPSDR